MSHFKPTAVDELSRGLSLGYVGTDMNVDFTCGCGYIPMRLAVSEFARKSAELARVPTIITTSKDGLPSFQYQYPSPIASRSTCATLVGKCRNHMSMAVRHQRDIPSPVTGRGNKISKMILGAVSRYHGLICSSRNVSRPLLCLQIC